MISPLRPKTGRPPRATSCWPRSLRRWARWPEACWSTTGAPVPSPWPAQAELGSPSVGPTTWPGRPPCWGRCNRAGTPWCGSTTRSPRIRSSSTCPTACRSVRPCSSCTGATRSSAFPRTSVRVGAGSALSVVEVFAGAEGAERSLVVPVTELAAADRRVAVVCLPADPRWRSLVDRPSGRPWHGELVTAHLHRRPRRLLRPGPRRRLGRGEGRPQRDPVRVSR